MRSILVTAICSLMAGNALLCGEPSYEQVKQRLQILEKLKADKVITEKEYSFEREEILKLLSATDAKAPSQQAQHNIASSESKGAENAYTFDSKDVKVVFEKANYLRSNELVARFRITNKSGADIKVYAGTPRNQSEYVPLGQKGPKSQKLTAVAHDNTGSRYNADGMSGQVQEKGDVATGHLFDGINAYFALPGKGSVGTLVKFFMADIVPNRPPVKFDCSIDFLVVSSGSSYVLPVSLTDATIE